MIISPSRSSFKGTLLFLFLIAVLPFIAFVLVSLFFFLPTRQSSIIMQRSLPFMRKLTGALKNRLGTAGVVGSSSVQKNKPGTPMRRRGRKNSEVSLIQSLPDTALEDWENASTIDSSAALVPKAVEVPKNHSVNLPVPVEVLTLKNDLHSPPASTTRRVRSTTRRKKQKGMSMASSVNSVRFKNQVQDKLRQSAKEMSSGSMFWITRPQALRTSNTAIRPGEQPTIIHLSVELVVPLLCLSQEDQTRLMDEFPPFFGTGVGILSERKKWKVVTAERLVRFLNPTDEDRALFLDVEIAKELGISYHPNKAIDIRGESSVAVYNACQLEDPYMGEPEKGVAINAVTGKRFSQPAHDILLAVGLLRGYISPMWVSEKQFRYLNLELNADRATEGVLVADMRGLVVPLSALPPPCIRLLLQLLKEKHKDAGNSDLFYLFGPNGWEASRTRVMVKHMAAIEDRKYPWFFVMVREFAYQFPKLGASLFLSSRRVKPFGRLFIEKASIEADAQLQEAKLLAEKEAAEKGKKKKKTGKKKDEARVGPPVLANSLLFVKKVKMWNQKEVRCFFAEDATMRRYYNAGCMKKPHLVVPSVRSIALMNGRLLGRRDEAILRTQAIKYKFSSPLWLNKFTAERMGVGILPKEEKKFATIGVAGLEMAGQEQEGFYNIDDFPNSDTILSVFPKSSKSTHFMLDSKWRPVMSLQKQAFLTSLKRENPLWVSVSECVMSGFEPYPGTALTTFPRVVAKDTTVAPRKQLYNSQQTTDPVRVIGLSTYLTRPQGVSL